MEHTEEYQMAMERLEGMGDGELMELRADLDAMIHRKKTAGYVAAMETADERLTLRVIRELMDNAGIVQVGDVPEMHRSKSD